MSAVEAVNLAGHMGSSRHDSYPQLSVLVASLGHPGPGASGWRQVWWLMSDAVWLWCDYELRVGMSSALCHLSRCTERRGRHDAPVTAVASGLGTCEV